MRPGGCGFDSHPCSNFDRTLARRLRAVVAQEAGHLTLTQTCAGSSPADSTSILQKGEKRWTTHLVRHLFSLWV